MSSGEWLVNIGDFVVVRDIVTRIYIKDTDKIYLIICVKIVYG